MGLRIKSEKIDTVPGTVFVSIFSSHLFSLLHKDAHFKKLKCRFLQAIIFY
jgi:hypothetical protein